MNKQKMEQQIALLETAITSATQCALTQQEAAFYSAVLEVLSREINLLFGLQIDQEKILYELTVIFKSCRQTLQGVK